MPNLKFKNVLLGFLSLIACMSLIQLSLRTIADSTSNASTGLHSLAYQFMPLKNIFKNISRAGYVTDKNIEHPLAIAQFQLAQYALAPTVLELNNDHLPLVIVDFTTPQAGMEHITATHLTPLTISPTGIILAVNPKPNP